MDIESYRNKLEKNCEYIFFFFQGNAYGYAYGNSGRRSQGGYHRGREEAQVEDTRLKNLIRDTKNAMNNTRQFWTQLPYELCRYEIAMIFFKYMYI